jgi:hypothetical protein
MRGALFALAAGYALAGTTFLPASSPLVAIHGRTVPGPNASLLLDWVGTAVRVRVSNNFTFVSATISDDCAGGNKFVVRMSAEGFSDLDVATLYTRTGTHEYTLFGDAGRANFVGAAAELTLIKAVEARFTQCSPLVGQALALVSLATDGAFLPPSTRTRRLELLGDSISCGDLVFCTDSAVGAPFTAANALWTDSHPASFGSRLCAALNATCTTIAWGGMGLIQNDVLSWTWPTIPDVYPSALAWPVSQGGQGRPLDYPWNFSAAPAPDALLISLGTNDAAGNFANATFAERFVSKYVAFVEGIAAAYAAARSGAGPAFFLANATCMTAVYGPSVAKVAGLLAAKGISATLVDYSLPGNARCACGHPSADQHLTMAQGALKVIRTVMGWEA